MNIDEIAVKVAREVPSYSYVEPYAYQKRFANALLAELANQKPVYWQYRTFYEDNTSTPGWSEWETIEPRGLLSVENQVNDLRIYIQRGCKYELRKLYAAPIPSAVPEGWQPIETAPKGELVSVWIDWENGTTECWLYCYYDSICGEWRTTRPSGHLRCVPERYVTHWMPLPAAPIPKEES